MNKPELLPSKPASSTALKQIIIMKKLLTTLAVAALALMGSVSQAEARSYGAHIYISGHQSCGAPIYHERYLIGHDHWGRPVWGTRVVRHYRPVVRYVAPTRHYVKPRHVVQSRYDGRYSRPRGHSGVVTHGSYCR
jgi:hypothetical protein